MADQGWVVQTRDSVEDEWISRWNDGAGGTDRYAIVTFNCVSNHPAHFRNLAARGLARVVPCVAVPEEP